MNDIKSLREELERIRESEERLRLLFDVTPDIVCFKDGEGRWLEANPADLKLFRLEGVDFRGKTDAQLAAYSPQFKKAFLTCMESDQQAWRKRTLSRSIEYIPDPDQGTRIFDIYKIPLFHRDGLRKGLIVLGRDVTELVHAKNVIENKRRQLEAINSILALAWENIPLKERIERILTQIFTVPWLSFESKGALFLYDKSKGELRLFAQKDMDSQLLSICSKIGLDQCLCGKAAKLKRILFYDHVKQDHENSYQGMEDHGHYVVPIMVKEELLGILCLYLKAGHSKNEEELQFLETLSRVLGQILSYEMKRAEMERALKRSERHLVNAQRMALMGSFELYPHRGEVILSEGLLRLLRLGDIGHHNKMDVESFLQFFSEEDKEVFRETLSSAIHRDEKASLDIRLKSGTGDEQEEIIAHCDLMPSSLLGRGLATEEEPFILGTLQDVTRLRFTERQLELASKIFEHSIEGITITDKDGNIIFVNPAFTRITGYRPDEVLGKNPRILKSDRHGPEFYKKMWQDILEKGVWSGEIWNRRKDGSAYPEHLTITVIKDPHGEVTNYVALFHDLTEIKEMEASLEFQVNFDALTGLPNRQLFKDRLSVAIRHAESHNEGLAIILFDIDDFRLVNEGIGYNIGDKILQEIAQRISNCIRKEDTASRLGGDEFAVLLEAIDSKEVVFEIAGRLLDVVSRPFFIDGHEVRITISIGITFFPEDGSEPEVLIKNAEMAMYRSKELGKNALHTFTSQMDAKIKRRIQLEEALHNAIKKQEFKLFYQPKVHLRSGRVLGAEALIRWFRRDEGLISPAEFIPIAEETGLIIEIGDWVLNEACRQFSEWSKRGYPINIAINLSPRQFRDKFLIEKIKSALRRHSVGPEALALEITEGVVMDDEENAIRVLNQLKDIGLRLVMDDFGTGYSSLYYLKQFPIDELKIDRSFVIDLPENSDNRAISAAIVSLSKNLGLETVAEGVETPAQLEFFMELGCDMIQGYLFSPPIPPDEFIAKCDEIGDNVYVK